MKQVLPLFHWYKLATYLLRASKTFRSTLVGLAVVGGAI